MKKTRCWRVGETAIQKMWMSSAGELGMSDEGTRLMGIQPSPPEELWTMFKTSTVEVVKSCHKVTGVCSGSNLTWRKMPHRRKTSRLGFEGLQKQLKSIVWPRGLRAGLLLTLSKDFQFHSFTVLNHSYAVWYFEVSRKHVTRPLGRRQRWKRLVHIPDRGH